MRHDVILWYMLGLCNAPIRLNMIISKTFFMLTQSQNSIFWLSAEQCIRVICLLPTAHSTAHFLLLSKYCLVLIGGSPISILCSPSPPINTTSSSTSVGSAFAEFTHQWDVALDFLCLTNFTNLECCGDWFVTRTNCSAWKSVLEYIRTQEVLVLIFSKAKLTNWKKSFWSAVKY